MEESQVKQLVDVLKAKKNLILQGAPGTGKTYLAKKIAEELIGDGYQTSDQFKIVQFHPSYTYEDFVRGISVDIKKDDQGHTYTSYEPVNKILGSFAKRAMENWEYAQKPTHEQVQRTILADKYSKFVNKLNDTINSEEPDVNLLRVARSVNISKIDLEDGSIVYDNSSYQPLTKQQFIDYCVQKYYQKIDSPKHKYANQDHLFSAVYSKFIEFIGDHEKALSYDKASVKGQGERAKPYILIIDEINRANLPMVFGELLYALEYRNRSVESMYAIEADNGICLPRNLYIIGTMNTADRSAGHIDYAIRRRFAFEYILPKVLEKNDLTAGDKFESDIFNKVQKLFDHNTWLSEEFEKRDVAIGHSYFITNKDVEKGMSKEMRIKYEIRPLLEEYVKDGILKREYGAYKIEDKLNEIFG